MRRAMVDKKCDLIRMVDAWALLRDPPTNTIVPANELQRIGSVSE
jgi:hypothetical protein